MSDFSFWEKNGGDIKKGAMVALAAGAALLVAGPVAATVGASAIYAARAGDSVKQEHNNDTDYRQKRFDDLKKSILMLRFQ